jgi:hypothetical protein
LQLAGVAQALTDDGMLDALAQLGMIDLHHDDKFDKEASGLMKRIVSICLDEGVLRNNPTAGFTGTTVGVIYHALLSQHSTYWAELWQQHTNILFQTCFNTPSVVLQSLNSPHMWTVVFMSARAQHVSVINVLQACFETAITTRNSASAEQLMALPIMQALAPVLLLLLWPRLRKDAELAQFVWGCLGPLLVGDTAPQPELQVLIKQTEHAVSCSLSYTCILRRLGKSYEEAQPNGLFAGGHVTVCPSFTVLSNG